MNKGLGQIKDLWDTSSLSFVPWEEAQQQFEMLDTEAQA